MLGYWSNIQDFCHGQIAHDKIRRYIRLVTAFPMSVTGKIRKHVLRDQMITDLGWAGWRASGPVSPCIGMRRRAARGSACSRYRNDRHRKIPSLGSC